MNKAKALKISVRVVVTFFEASIAFWIATGQLVTKTALVGALGAGLSALYNLYLHYSGTTV